MNNNKTKIKSCRADRPTRSRRLCSSISISFRFIRQNIFCIGQAGSLESRFARPVSAPAGEQTGQTQDFQEPTPSSHEPQVFTNSQQPQVLTGSHELQVLTNSRFSQKTPGFQEPELKPGCSHEPPSSHKSQVLINSQFLRTRIDGEHLQFMCPIIRGDSP